MGVEKNREVVQEREPSLLMEGSVGSASRGAQFNQAEVEDRLALRMLRRERTPQGALT